MKSYVTGQEMRLVGKAWEIRRQLQLLLERTGPTVTLQQYLSDHVRSYPQRNAAPYFTQPRQACAAVTSRVIPFPLNGKN